MVNDIRAKYEPNWTRRGMWDKSYYEARVPEVPALLMELLSHQNFADMKYGLDPQFRFDVSRAIYKGIAKFIAKRDHRECVIQPLPVNSFAINKGSGMLFTYADELGDAFQFFGATGKPAGYMIVFCYCAVAYLIGWVIMKTLVPKYKPITK